MSSIRRLRASLNSGALSVLPTSCDAYSTRLAALGGCPGAVIGRAAVANTLLGLSDASLVTLSEMAFVVERTASVVSIPVMVDVGEGFGKASNVRHSVRTLERAGAAGVLISDGVDTAGSGLLAKDERLRHEEMLGKVKAAVDAHTNPDFIVLARTRSGVEGDVGSAAELGNLYVSVGADAIMVDGVATITQLRQLVTTVRAPYLFVNLGTALPDISHSMLSEIGFQGAIEDNLLVFAQTLGMQQFLADFYDRGVDAFFGLRESLKGSPLENWYHFLGFDEIREIEERYLPKEELAQRYNNSQSEAYYRPGVK
jgi:2-methylisocitrate lyase-like PEP mutase family enzyme